MKKLLLVVLVCLISLAGCVKVQTEVVKKFKIVDSLVVTVDYSKSILEVVELGAFDWFNSDITAEAPFQTSRGVGIKEEEIIIIKFDSDVTSIEVETSMRAKNLVPANIWHAGYLAQKYPDFRQTTFVFLGTVWRDLSRFGRVAILNSYDGERHLVLSWPEYIWDDFCRFAAVKKSEK